MAFFFYLGYPLHFISDKSHVQQTVKVAFICHCVRLFLSQKCSCFILHKWIILERSCTKEVSYLALSGRKALHFLITADVSALAALNQKRPLHLWSVTCPSFCGPEIDDEEGCSDEMFHKSWHTEDIWAQTYILDLSHLSIMAQLWLESRLSALSWCLRPSTPNPLPPFFLPAMHSSVS